MFKNSTATEKLNRYVRDSGGDFGKAVLHGVSPNRLYELSLLEKIAGVSPKPATEMIEAQPTPVAIVEEPEPNQPEEVEQSEKEAPEPEPTPKKKSKSKKAKS
ncbi:MAG: hypothetical protein KAJ03_01240 [Gammaproteobacteria bacterium]|nr:hypothetical protein [Gammaproteobacteria bacterium]